MRSDNRWQRMFAIGLLVVLLGPAGVILSPRKAATRAGESKEPRAETPGPMGKRLIENLGCVACHTIEGHTTTVEKEAPDLTLEGDKVRPEWLFAFLKKPHILRPWLNARMPTFRLSDREALALTKFIREELRDRAAVTHPAEPASAQRVYKELAEAGEQLVSKRYFDCFSCHTVGGRKPEGPREGWAPDLVLAAARLNPDWILRWLRDPQKIQPGTKMPSYFTGPDSGPPEILGGAEDQQMRALQAWLLDRGAPGTSESYAQAKALNADIRPAEGRRLMVELNCRGCHTISGLPEGRKIAPVLSYAGSKFRREWLVAFLKGPHPLRAAGYILGWQSRMPDFRFSDEEAQAVAEHLMTLTYPDLAQGGVREERTLTRLKKFQARKLFAKSEGCIGCHRIKNQRGEVVGGVSGPDLSRAGDRMQGNFIYNFIRNPRVFEPTGKMEIFGDFLSDKDARVLAEYLSTQK